MNSLLFLALYLNQDFPLPVLTRTPLPEPHAPDHKVTEICLNSIQFTQDKRKKKVIISQMPSVVSSFQDGC